MQLELLHPEVARRDCQTCLQYVFHEDGPKLGQLMLDDQGRPMKRPKGTRAPCRRQSESCPKGTAEKPIELTDANRQAWQFYLKCKLTGRWPDDELVLEMGVMLDDLYRRVDRFRQMEFLTTLAGLRG